MHLSLIKSNKLLLIFSLYLARGRAKVDPQLLVYIIKDSLPLIQDFVMGLFGIVNDFTTIALNAFDGTSGIYQDALGQVVGLAGDVLDNFVSSAKELENTRGNSNDRPADDTESRELLVESADIIISEFETLTAFFEYWTDYLNDPANFIDQEVMETLMDGVKKELRSFQQKVEETHQLASESSMVAQSLVGKVEADLLAYGLEKIQQFIDS